MRLEESITGLLVYGFYPCWLLAGGVDYWCHRRTDIADTSGPMETRLHIAQFIAMAFVIVPAVVLRPGITAVVACAAAAVVHLLLSYIDVSYTQRRRFISPLEQHVHAFLDVLPIVAVSLIAVLALADPAATNGFELRQGAFSPGSLALIGSFLVVAGGPVIEEHLRAAHRSHIARDRTSVSAEEVMP